MKIQKWFITDGWTQGELGRDWLKYNFSLLFHPKTETFKLEGITFTYFRSTLCLMVQGKETKISIAMKIIDEKLLKITQEDIQKKWSTDKKDIDEADEEELELTEKEKIIMERMKIELTKDTADFIQSWNPKRTSLRRKLEKNQEFTWRIIWKNTQMIQMKMAQDQVIPDQYLKEVPHALVTL